MLSFYSLVTAYHIMDENKNSNDELALSNSQLKWDNFLLTSKSFAPPENSYFDIADYSARTGYVNSYIDRLTITGNLPDEYQGVDDPFGIYSWNKLAIFPEGGWRGQYFSDRKQKLYLEYDPANAKIMRKRNFRIECNPNLLDDEQLDFLFKIILPKLAKPAISRIDLAFDYERNLSEYVFDKAASGGKFWDKAGRTQTIYCGAPSSAVRIRLYDKKAERKAKGSEEDKTEYDAYDELWRLEFEITGSGVVEREIKYGFDSLNKSKITKTNYDLELDVPLSTQEKIMLKALDQDKNLYADLSAKTKAKYKRLAEKVRTVDLSGELRPILKNMQICSNRPRKIDTVAFCKAILAGENPWN